MSRIINKLIRKISGSELAQKQNASIIKNGKPNEKMEVRLNPRKLDDFHPDSIVDQVPELRAVYAIRQALTELKGNLSQNKEFRKQLEALLAMLGKERDPERRSELLSTIGIGPMPDKR